MDTKLIVSASPHVRSDETVRLITPDLHRFSILEEDSKLLLIPFCKYKLLHTLLSASHIICHHASA